jgi:membrane-bound metal-dependent hydrolase YbcI (DUF457 family)
MMGQTHALSGGVAWLALTPFLAKLGMPLGPAQLGAGVAICAGAALLPDIDHHDGTIANTFGPVTRVLCRAVGAIFGGHRNGTHSIVFAVGAGFGTAWLAVNMSTAWLVVVFLLVGLVLKGLGLGTSDREHLSAGLNAVIAAGIAVSMANLDFGRPAFDLGWYGITLGWPGIAVTLGCLVHVIGDMLTPKGCAVFWPAPGRPAIPIMSKTDGVVERWVIAPLLLFGGLVLVLRSQLGYLATMWLGYRA